MNFLLGIDLSAEGVFGAILHAARSLFYWISELVYKIIPMLYNLFQDIAGAKLLTNEAFADVTAKVGYLLGLIMLLIVIFDFIQLLIDPEKMFDKERGMFAIVKKIIFVLVGLGISNFVFNSLYWVQDYVLDNQIISKLVLPSSEANVDEKLFGRVLAARTFTAFYTVRVDLDESNAEAVECEQYRNLLISRIVYNNDFSAGNYCLNQTTQGSFGDNVDKEDVFIMDYNFILQLVVGVMIVYLFVNYVITVGIRAIQLTVLQIVFPMCLIGYLSPKKENVFTKWCKMYFSTYIDVFIRCGIIYFIVYLCALIMDSMTAADNEFWLSVSENGSSELLIMVVMILALLTFAKKAPELIKTLLPAGDSKLGFGASWKDIVGLQKGAKIGTSVLGGAVGGAAIGLIGGGLGGFAGGLLKGGLGGLKGQGIGKSASSAWKAQADYNRKNREWRASGGTSGFSRRLSSLQQSVGAMTDAERQDEQITLNERRIQELKNSSSTQRRTAKIFKSAKDIKKQMEDRAESKLLNGTFKENDVRYNMQKRILEAKHRIDYLKEHGASAEEIASATMNYNRVLKHEKEGYISEFYAGNITSDDDAVMDGFRGDLNSLIEHNQADFNGIDTNITNFATLDNFDAKVSQKYNIVNREISNSDQEIEVIENDILKLKTSNEYIRAHADSNFKK